MSTSFRRRVELTAGPVLVLLGRLPRFAPFLLVLVLLVTGLVVQGVVGGLLLLLLAALVAVLVFLSWPALLPQARAIRLVVLALVVVRALTFLA